MSCDKIICEYCNVEILNVYDNDIYQTELGVFIHKKCDIKYFDKLGYSMCSFCDYDYGKELFICRNTCLEINNIIDAYLTIKNIKYGDTYWHKNCFVGNYVTRTDLANLCRAYIPEFEESGKKREQLCAELMNAIAILGEKTTDV